MYAPSLLFPAMPSLPDALERNYPYLVLAASVGMIVFASGVGQLLVVCLTAIAEEFGWPRTVPSAAWGMFLIGSGFSGILMGHWMDRRGMARPALLGAVMLGAGAVAVAFVQSAWQLYLVFGLILGFAGRGPLYAPLLANASHWFNHRRGMAIGIVSAGEPLSGAIWPPVIYYLQEAIGWRYTFVLFGLCAWAVMLPLSLVFRRRPPVPAIAVRPAASVPQPGARPALSHARIQAVLCAAVVCCCLPMAMPLVHLVAHVGDICGEPARGAEMLSITLLTSFISRGYLLGKLTERIGGLGTLFVFSSIQVSGLLLMAYVTDLAALYVVAILFGIGYGGVLPNYPVIVREYLPGSEAGRRSATVVVFGSFGMAIGGWLAGRVFDVTGGYAVAFLIGVGFNLLNLAIVALLIRQKMLGRLSSA